MCSSPRRPRRSPDAARELAVGGWLFLRHLHPGRALHPADGPRPVRPPCSARLGATTVAAWYLAIFTGSLTAGFSRRPGTAAPAAILLPRSHRRCIPRLSDASSCSTGALAPSSKRASLSARRSPPPSRRAWPPMSKIEPQRQLKSRRVLGATKGGWRRGSVNRRGL